MALRDTDSVNKITDVIGDGIMSNNWDASAFDRWLTTDPENQPEPANHKTVIPPDDLGMGNPRYIAEGVAENRTATFHLFHKTHVNEIISYEGIDYLITNVTNLRP